MAVSHEKVLLNDLQLKSGLSKDILDIQSFLDKILSFKIPIIKNYEKILPLSALRIEKDNN